MTREEVNVQFSGLAHDHLMLNKDHQQDFLQANSTGFPCCPPGNKKHNNFDPSRAPTKMAPSALSTIAILRRHPMYDSLVLVKRFRACLNGYTLEFPTSNVDNGNHDNNHDDDDHRCKLKITTNTTNSSQLHEDCCKTKLVSVYLDGDDPIYQCQERNGQNGINSPEGDEIVHVPMNGLLDRLENYDRHGISIDSRVYAFAMGLKTAERFLTTSSMKEIQETPPL